MKISFDFEDHAGGLTPAARGHVVFEPSHKHLHTDGGLGTIRPFTIKFNKPFVVDLEATTPNWAWKITVNIGADVFTGYYIVDRDTDFEKLVKVDPTTLEPDAEPEPAWWAMARSTVNGGEVVDGYLWLTRADGTRFNAGYVQGKDGLNGRDGYNGRDGLPGKDGVDGAPGAPGTPGTPGVNGERGSKWFYGTVNPVTIPGSLLGDSYLNTVSGDVFQLGATVWVKQGNLKTDPLVRLIPVKNMTDAASTYSNGVTMFAIEAAADGGWPWSFGLAVVQKYGVRSVMNVTMADNRNYRRTSGGSDVWTAFIQTT